VKNADKTKAAAPVQQAPRLFQKKSAGLAIIARTCAAVSAYAGMVLATSRTTTT
jgi:hypothetical protein